MKNERMENRRYSVKNVIQI